MPVPFHRTMEAWIVAGKYPFGSPLRCLPTSRGVPTWRPPHEDHR